MVGGIVMNENLPPMAAFDAIQTSSSSKEGVRKGRRKIIRRICFHSRHPKTVPRTCTVRAITEKRIQEGPIDKADERFAATPMDAKKERKKNSLH